jgi:tagatose-1,6-bisphosphate aldolase non-catalytic subunit AgaZ/GatZ
MPIPIYLQESDDIAKRRYELRKQQAAAKHEFLLASDPQYAKEYYHGLEQQRLAEINNSIVENAEKTMQKLEDDVNLINGFINPQEVGKDELREYIKKVFASLDNNTKNQVKAIVINNIKQIEK